MDGLLRDPAQFSQLELLVAQQRYDESLELLNDAIAKNPRDRAACLCRLLVARIVMLRRPLAGLSQFRLSKSKVLSLGLACARTAGVAWRAVCRITISRWPHRPFRWLRTLEDSFENMGSAGSRWREIPPFSFSRGVRKHMKHFVVLSAQRLRTLGTTLSQRLCTNMARRFVLLTSERDPLSQPRRRLLPVTAVSALSLLAAFAVSAVLLRGGDTSPRQLLDAPSRRTLPPAVVNPPVPEAELVAVPRSQALAESRPPADSVKERVPFAEPQERTPVTTEKFSEKVKQQHKPRAQEEKARAKVPPHKSEPVAKKNQSAVLRDLNDLAHAKKAPAAGAVARTSTHFYRARRPIAVRQSAKYAAPTVEKLSEGAVVAVLDVKNSWARVTLDGKAPGFVRIEYLGPVEIP